MLGEYGQNVCPNGYDPITFPNTCELASTMLGLPYSQTDTNERGDSVCYSCGNCSPVSTRVSPDYDSYGQWVCQKEGYETGGYHIT